MQDDARRLREALQLDAAGARLEVELLVRHVLQVDRARFIAHPELAQRAAQSPEYRALLERRVAGEPIAYLLGMREFYGRGFEVDPTVLVPRPETELLVELALERVPSGASSQVLDVGTGSGCIAISIALERARAAVTALDLSEAALAVATRNAARLNARNVRFALGDAYAPVTDTRFDVIVSNPPYIAQGDPHLVRGDLRFEPQLALVGGSDGLSVLRVLIEAGGAHLNAGGWLLLEHGFDQGEAVRAMMRGAGLDEVFTHVDLAGLPRVSGGHWRGAKGLR